MKDTDLGDNLFRKIRVLFSDTEAETFFFEIWEGLTSQYNIENKTLQSTFKIWFNKMKKRTGWYHSWGHLIDLMDHLEAGINNFQDPVVVKWAILFHDAIYRPGFKNNEAQSAKLMKRCFDEINLPKNLALKVEKFILATNSNKENLDIKHYSEDLKLFLDIDQLILASSPSKYNSYLSGIVSEYSKFPTCLLIKRRKLWLQSMLNKDSIFFSKLFREKFEHAARKNLTEELQRGWSFWGLKGIYDPAEHRMENYLKAKGIFEDNRMSLLQDLQGQSVLVGINGNIESIDKSLNNTSDVIFDFIVRTEDDERQYLLKRYTNIYDPLIQPFLDTDMPEWRHEARLALKLRGASQWNIRLLHIIIATGAWWNTLAWEWEGIAYAQFQWWLKLNALPAGILGFTLGILGTGSFLIELYGLLFGILFALSWAFLVQFLLKKANLRFFGSKNIPEDAGFG